MSMPAPSTDARVSVLLITYNHEGYVEKAIDSVLMQEVDFDFDIVVADDGSSDGTLSLIREIADQNPSVSFRFLRCDENVGITKNYQRAFAACDAEYIAVLEGDDYWVSPKKLAQQFRFLEKHRECDLCSVNYYVYEEGRAQFTPRVPPEQGHVVLGARELISDNLVGNFSTCMYRSRALKQLPDALFEARSYDWAVNICVARYGLIGFLREPMSVYRIHDRGAWSLLSHVQKLKAQLELIPTYDKITDGVFHYEFAVLAERLSKVIADAQGAQVVHAQSAALEVMSLPPQRHRVLDLVPPFMITVGRQLLPPFLKRHLIRLVFGGKGE
ncbi:glycosyltransferase [Pseudoxanthomonas mexicana]|uniref:glycosyltransferase n=1 Tax=Pseudoxanthomonas mexicana TaxID=128785 RepID=UPI0024E24980|nr:glycosyltransferase [Pseudoxanthomonas mexicana]